MDAADRADPRAYHICVRHHGGRLHHRHRARVDPRRSTRATEHSGRILAGCHARRDVCHDDRCRMVHGLLSAAGCRANRCDLHGLRFVVPPRGTCDSARAAAGERLPGRDVHAGARNGIDRRRFVRTADGPRIYGEHAWCSRRSPCRRLRARATVRLAVDLPVHQRGLARGRQRDLGSRIAASSKAPAEPRRLAAGPRLRRRSHHRVRRR